MDKLKIIVARLSLAAFFRSATSKVPVSVWWWRVILGTSIFMAIIIAFSAFLMYGWATSAPIVSSTFQNESEPVSTDEIQNVIALYQKKESTYETLRHSSPAVPSLGLGKGVSVSVDTALTPN